MENMDGQRDLSIAERKKLVLEKETSCEIVDIEEVTEIIQKPTEDEWFKVKPQTIDQKIFKKKRHDIRQERARMLILEAFKKMEENPTQYGKEFRTMMPKKKWRRRNVLQLKEIACKLGDHNAVWFEQAFEWAQRIANGETWQAICNDADTANCYRLVIWENGYARIVGGSVFNSSSCPSSYVNFYNYYDYYELTNTVPLIVDYEH